MHESIFIAYMKNDCDKSAQRIFKTLKKSRNLIGNKFSWLENIDDLKERSDREKLYDNLSNSLQSDFEKILFVMNPPPGIISDRSAPLSTRVKDFLDWIESLTGPGFQAFKQTILKPVEIFLFNGEPNNFTEKYKLKKTLKKYSIGIVILGKEWKRATNKNGRRCIDDPENLFRVAIEEILDRDDMYVITVLTDNVSSITSGCPSFFQQLFSAPENVVTMDNDFQEMRILSSKIDQLTQQGTRETNSPSRNQEIVEILKDKYLREEIRCINENKGNISKTNRIYLNALREAYDISSEEARQIKKTAKLYCQSTETEYQIEINYQIYESVFRQMLQDNVIDDLEIENLERLKDHLELDGQRVNEIEDKIRGEFQEATITKERVKSPSNKQEILEFMKDAYFEEAIDCLSKNEGTISKTDQIYLDALRQANYLSRKESRQAIIAAELYCQNTIKDFQIGKNYQIYESVFRQMMQDNVIDNLEREKLERLKERLELNGQRVKEIEDRIRGEFQE